MSILKFSVSIFVLLIWLSNSVIINSTQLFLSTFLRPISKKWFRRINYYLIYTSWSQIVALAQHWCNCKLILYFPDEDSKNMLGNEFSLSVMNHKYEIDWLFTWLAMDYAGNLGTSKSYLKKSLKHLPFIGWSFYLSEFIFLERNWEKDSKIMDESFDNLKDYEHNVNLLVFAEGTRFTKDKYEQSCKFARERNLKQLKHHLIPRTRGFSYTVKHLKDHLASLFNAQIEFASEDSNRPTLINLLKGVPITGHFYVERTPIEQVPTSSIEELNDYLFKFYEKKDEITEEFLQKKKFDTKYIIEAKPRLTPLINLIFWVITQISIFFFTTRLLIFYQYYKLVYSIFIFFGLIGFAAITLIIRSTKIGRGSTYGSSKDEKKKS